MNPLRLIDVSLYKPSELNQYLQKLGIKPKKGLSQNFLIDGNIVRKIIATADIQPADTVLEIGPGPGAVSEAIVATGAKLIAVEKDKVLAEALKRLPAEIYCADILEFDLPKVTKVISNLPYHISTPVISQLITRSYEKIVVMVQDELAVRMTANPGCKDYGSFTLFLNFYSHVHYAFKVSRKCFYPVPKVDSAIVVLTPKQPPQVDSEAFFKMTRTAFGHKRKMLRSSLKEDYPNIQQALYDSGFPETTRPEDLSCDQFVKLFRNLLFF